MLQKLKRQLDVGRAHADIFGYTSAVRAGLSMMIGPKYSAERFDRQFGVDTSALSLIESQIPEHAIAEAVHYEPANVDVLRHVFRSVPFRHQDFHLVDLGCGKGRTLLVGAEYPFKAITGVELSEVTAAVARENITRYLQKHSAACRAIGVQCENAADFTVPSGPLFVTLYNPFLGRTFRQCIEHLHASAGDREVWLAYINPWHCEETLEQSGYFRQVQRHRPLARNWTWSLWTHV